MKIWSFCVLFTWWKRNKKVVVNSVLLTMRKYLIRGFMKRRVHRITELCEYRSVVSYYVEVTSLKFKMAQKHCSRFQKELTPDEALAYKYLRLTFDWAPPQKSICSHNASIFLFSKNLILRTQVASFLRVQSKYFKPFCSFDILNLRFEKWSQEKRRKISYPASPDFVNLILTMTCTAEAK